MACLIEKSLNESLHSRDRDFESKCQLSRLRMRLSEVSLSFETDTEKLLIAETKTKNETTI